MFTRFRMITTTTENINNCQCACENEPWTSADEVALRGGERQHQDVRGLWGEAAKLRAAVRADEAVVLRLREATRRGGRNRGIADETNAH